MEFDDIIREVRSSLREKNWRLVLYRGIDEFKGETSWALCHESQRRIHIGTKNSSEKEILWAIAHEFAHFEQSFDSERYNGKEVDSAYQLYSDFMGGESFKEEELYKARGIVIEYEYDADKMALKWLKDRDVPLDGFIELSNAHNIIIRYSFFFRSFPSIYVEKIVESLSIPDRWFSRKERHGRLKASQIGRLLEIGSLSESSSDR